MLQIGINTWNLEIDFWKKTAFCNFGSRTHRKAQLFLKESYFSMEFNDISVTCPRACPGALMHEKSVTVSIYVMKLTIFSRENDGKKKSIARAEKSTESETKNAKERHGTNVGGSIGVLWSR